MHHLFRLFMLSATALGYQGHATRQSDSIQILELQHYEGSGCAPGSVTTTVNPDHKSITVSFGFGSIPPTSPQMPCDLLFTLLYPTGCTSAVIDAVYNGHEDLSPGFSGNLTTNYAISGITSGEAPPPTFFEAGVSAPWTRTDVITADTTISGNSQPNVTFEDYVMLSLSDSAAIGQVTISDMTIAISREIPC
ncbi:hypothetical protein Daus18300_006027 [Diaporthe australafricana]|uniref:Secreted protein n=1 Tax=Diaporthe australafricana TaxID=127596 RepID=A0ABR3WXS3_9PEZI